MLPAGAETEVRAGNDEIPCLYLGSKGGVSIFQYMFCQFREVTSQMSQPSRGNVVGRDTIAEFEGSSLKPLHYLPGVGDFTGDSCCCCRRWATQIDKGFRIAHSPLESSVSRGQARFPVT